MKLPIFRAVGRAYRLVFSNLYSFIFVPALGVFSALQFVQWMLKTKGIDLGDYEREFVEAITQGGDAGAELQWTGELLTWLGIEALIVMVGGAIIAAAGMRYVLKRKAQSKPEFRFGFDELRILAAWLTATVIGLTSFALLYLGLVLLANVLEPLPDLVKAPIAIVYVLFMLVAAIWFAVRTSLVCPAAVAEQNFGLRGSFRATEGNVLRLLLFWPFIIIPFVALQLGASYVLFGAYSPLAAKNVNPDLHLVFNFGMFLIQTAMYVAGAGASYLLLKEPGEKAPANPQ